MIETPKGAGIRPATIHDLPGAYRVCLQTGDSGADATSKFHNPDLLGHVYVGPYVVGEPDSAFVVADDQGVAGFILAANDTIAFQGWAEEHWWPELRAQYPVIHGDSEDARITRMLHNPPRAEQSVLETHPAHLHIDLLPRVNGQGFGRALMVRLFEHLRKRNVRGVHLEVGTGNTNATAFYRHLGFVPLVAHSDSEVMGFALS